MTKHDELVGRLRDTGRRFNDGDILQAVAAIEAQADTITRLQNLLDVRDQFIVDHGLWQEFVDSLSCPAATINPPADPDRAGPGEVLRGSAVASRAATSDGPASPATSVPSGPLAQRLVELIQTIKDLSCPTARIERPRHNLDEVWGIADELMGRLPAALSALSAAPEAGQ